MRRSMVTADYLRGKYPKQRPELPDAFRRIYDEHYLNNRKAGTRVSSISGKMESWMHKKVAEPAREKEWSTLEIGAGTLNHLSYEEPVGPYDIVEPYSLLYEGSGKLGMVGEIYRDVSEIGAAASYDRIISIAVLEHISNLPEVVARGALLLKPGGIFQAAVPSEGTWLWKLGTCLSGLEFRRKYGLDYRLMMAHEHLNTAAEIEGILEFFFMDVKCSVFGLSKGVSFYRYYECRRPCREKAGEFISVNATPPDYNEVHSL